LPTATADQRLKLQGQSHARQWQYPDHHHCYRCPQRRAVCPALSRSPKPASASRGVQIQNRMILQHGARQLAVPALYSGIHTGPCSTRSGPGQHFRRVIGHFNHSCPVPCCGHAGWPSAKGPQDRQDLTLQAAECPPCR
jgi:hypothetical protein